MCLSFYISGTSSKEFKEQEEQRDKDKTNTINTKTHMRDMIVQVILPAIRNKWPEWASKTIYIQQDNSKPHILDNDLGFKEKATLEGFSFHLVQQPKFSRHECLIQELQHQKSTYNYSQSVKAVNFAFEALQLNALKFVWITLQACKVEVIKKLGDIDYHIPHMNKTKLAREGRLLDFLDLRKEIIWVIAFFGYKDWKEHVWSHLILGINDEEHFHQIEQHTKTEPTEPRTEPASIASTVSTTKSPSTEPVST